MVGVCSEIKNVDTKFDKVSATLETSWDSYPGSTDIYFLLVHEYASNEYNHEFVKEYELRTGIWKTGFFNAKDVLDKYGIRFDNWVVSINKKKFVDVEGNRIYEISDYPLVKPRKKRHKEYDW